MAAVCYPLASPPGTIRLWIGVHPASAMPAVADWRLDGVPVPAANVTSLRAMGPVRAGELAATKAARVFTGVYEIAAVSPGTIPSLAFTVDGEVLEQRVRALPNRLVLGGEPLTVLLVSCFHYTTGSGPYQRLLPDIVRGAHPPDLAIFMGDQVYLDLPTVADFENDAEWLAVKFERDYVRNWFSGAFTAGLGLAPMAMLPDDHEFWNNFPHSSPFIQNSWAQPGRDRWETAARACYAGFQHGSGDLLGTPLALDIEPLAFLMLDSRTDRDRDFTRLLRPEASRQVADWATRVADDSRFSAAVVVTGQSLLEDPVGTVKGGVADYALANYKEPYRDLLLALEAVAGAGKQVLLLTGDVHWGRVTTVRDRRRVPEATVFHELISSPASLVETIGSDQVATAIGVVKGWFGGNDPWPRHGDAQPPPSHLPHANQRFRTGPWRAHRGNQCAVLRMARRGAGVSVEYTFHPLITTARSGAAPTTGRFDLGPVI